MQPLMQQTRRPFVMGTAIERRGKKSKRNPAATVAFVCIRKQLRVVGRFGAFGATRLVEIENSGRMKAVIVRGLDEPNSELDLQS